MKSGRLIELFDRHNVEYIPEDFRGFITKRPDWIVVWFKLRKLIKHDPKVIIDGLVGYDNLHFYPFGGIKELIKWKNELKDV